MPEFESIPLSDTPYVSGLARDYITGGKCGGFQPGIPDYATISNKAATRNFDSAIKDKLSSVLIEQYLRDGIELKAGNPVYDNIVSLQKQETYTFTTGQQIHILLGPLFFIYKIQSLLSHVTLFNQLNPALNVVPVFWMATEDHDLEEINHVYLYGEKYTWDAVPGDAVGRLKCNGIPELIDKLEKRADKTEENRKLFSRFRNHYVAGKSLSAATRSLLHDLFGDQGLICLDPDDRSLKEIFIQTAYRECREEWIYQLISRANRDLKAAGFDPRVNPVPCNFFWLDDHKRIKIKKQGQDLIREDNQAIFLKERMLEEPEKLSPNVLLRPVYQECILPNLLYLAGSAEIEYWLPLQPVFEALEIPFPVLLQRDSVLLLSEKNRQFLRKTGIKAEQMFGPETSLADLYFKNAGGQDERAGKTLSALKNEMSLLREVLESMDDTPGQVFSELNQADKSIARIGRFLGDRTLKNQKLDPVFEKLIRIKSKFFDRKQEREEFTLSYPFMLPFDANREGMMQPSLFIGYW